MNPTIPWLTDDLYLPLCQIVVCLAILIAGGRWLRLPAMHRFQKRFVVLQSMKWWVLLTWGTMVYCFLLGALGPSHRPLTVVEAMFDALLVLVFLGGFLHEAWKVIGALLDVGPKPLHLPPRDEVQPPREHTSPDQDTRQ